MSQRATRHRKAMPRLSRCIRPFVGAASSSTSWQQLEVVIFLLEILAQEIKQSQVGCRLTYRDCRMQDKVCIVASLRVQHICFFSCVLSACMCVEHIPARASPVCGTCTHSHVALQASTSAGASISSELSTLVSALTHKDRPLACPGRDDILLCSACKLFGRLTWWFADAGRAAAPRAAQLVANARVTTASGQVRMPSEARHAISRLVCVLQTGADVESLLQVRHLFCAPWPKCRRSTL